jgi:hypothetical protein
VPGSQLGPHQQHVFLDRPEPRPRWRDRDAVPAVAHAKALAVIMHWSAARDAQPRSRDFTFATDGRDDGLAASLLHDAQKLN